MPMSFLNTARRPLTSLIKFELLVMALVQEGEKRIGLASRSRKSNTRNFLKQKIAGSMNDRRHKVISTVFIHSIWNWQRHVGGIRLTNKKRQHSTQLQG